MWKGLEWEPTQVTEARVMFRRFKRAGDLVTTLSKAEGIKHEVMARTE